MLLESPWNYSSVVMDIISIDLSVGAHHFLIEHFFHIELLLMLKLELTDMVKSNNSTPFSRASRKRKTYPPNERRNPFTLAHSLVLLCEPTRAHTQYMCLHACRKYELIKSQQPLLSRARHQIDFEIGHILNTIIIPLRTGCIENVL